MQTSRHALANPSRTYFTRPQADAMPTCRCFEHYGIPPSKLFAKLSHQSRRRNGGGAFSARSSRRKPLCRTARQRCGSTQQVDATAEGGGRPVTAHGHLPLTPRRPPPDRAQPRACPSSRPADSPSPRRPAKPGTPTVYTPRGGGGSPSHLARNHVSFWFSGRGKGGRIRRFLSPSSSTRRICSGQGVDASHRNGEAVKIRMVHGMAPPIKPVSSCSSARQPVHKAPKVRCNVDHAARATGGVVQPTGTMGEVTHSEE